MSQAGSRAIGEKCVERFLRNPVKCCHVRLRRSIRCDVHFYVSTAMTIFNNVRTKHNHGSARANAMHSMPTDNGHRLCMMR